MDAVVGGSMSISSATVSVDRGLSEPSPTFRRGSSIVMTSKSMSNLQRLFLLTTICLLSFQVSDVICWIHHGSSASKTTSAFHSGWKTQDGMRFSKLMGGGGHFTTTRTNPSPSYSSYSFRLWMGKGDGKKKRKKKSALPTSPAPAPEVKIEPMRVTTNSNVSVKRQIKWAQMNKDYQRKISNPGFRQKKVVRTKYRRTWDEEEIEQKAEERRRRGQDPNWDVILNQTKASPLVIVDGYNIINKWPRLKKHMSKGDTQRARQLLIEDLENLQSLKGWRIECVFDGTRRSVIGPLGHGPRGSDKVTAGDRATNIDETKHGVRVVYTGRGIEADSYIESRCGEAKEVTDGYITGSFIVATDDAMIRIAGQNAGALCMGAQRFVDELKAMKKAMEYRVEAAVAKANGQSVRPEKLRGTAFHTFGRNSVVIEDKEARKARRKAEQQQQKQQLEADMDEIQVEEDENGIPWWAQAPNQTKTWP